MALQCEGLELMTESIIDISPTIEEEMAVWPGDVKFTRRMAMSTEAGQHMDLSSIQTTVHVGAHADAPSHFRRDGVGIDQVALEAYIGRCYVHSVLGKRQIDVSDCEIPIQLQASRILFRTLSFPDPRAFHEDFVFFTPEAVAYMGQHGVRLIGIDTPSVDPFSSKELSAHQTLFEFNIRNLEGLVLEHVLDGFYELIALPLKIKDSDASPVRAILRPYRLA